MENLSITTTNENIKVKYESNQSESYLEMKNGDRKKIKSSAIELAQGATLILGTNPKYTLKLKTINGNIKIKEFIGHELEIETVTGEVTLHNIITPKIYTRTETGDIMLASSITENCYLTTPTGIISVIDLQTIRGTMNSAGCGDISLNNTLVAEQLSMMSTNGNIYGENIRAQKINTWSANGNIIIEELTSDNINTETINGKTFLEINGNEDDYQEIICYGKNPKPKPIYLRKKLIKAKARNNGRITISYTK